MSDMHRFILKVFFISFGLASSIACDEPIFLKKCDGDCATVSGRLLTGAGKDPVENITMKVRWYRYIYSGFNESKIVAQTRTNSDGSYILKFNAEEEGHYEVIIENPDEYFKLHDKEFHEFGLPSNINNDSALVRDYIMPFKAKLIIAFEDYMTTQNYYSLNISFPLGVDFNQASGYYISWSDAQSEYKHVVEVGALVPIYLRKTIVINDTTYLHEYDTITVGRDATYQYDLAFARH